MNRSSTVMPMRNSSTRSQSVALMPSLPRSNMLPPLCQPVTTDLNDTLAPVPGFGIASTKRASTVVDVSITLFSGIYAVYA